MMQAAGPIDDNIIGTMIQLDSACYGGSSILLHQQGISLLHLHVMCMCEMTGRCNAERLANVL